jgi:hypothetical protein
MFIENEELLLKRILQFQPNKKRVNYCLDFPTNLPLIFPQKGVLNFDNIFKEILRKISFTVDITYATSIMLLLKLHFLLQPRPKFVSYKLLYKKTCIKINLSHLNRSMLIGAQEDISNTPCK